MPLTTEQCEILGALLAEGTDPLARTTDLLARRLNMSPKHVGSSLAELQARSPALVRLVFDETWRLQTWLTTGAAQQAYDRSCRS